ncbi:MAG: laccase domain-containing protein [Pseudomonadota bacterium]|nr:laccase domain-containing protein [Pseudomonadota bacterium]
MICVHHALNVFGGEFCTYREPSRFFSYRRDGVTGRMATLLWKSS